MKYLLIIGDGMADNPVPALSGQTPLERAHIPVADSLAARGRVGQVRTVPEGLPPGSDTAILSIFGCDPRRCYTGRAPLEAAAAGLRLEPGDAAYRCNMVTLEDGDMPFAEKRILSHSAGSIDGDASMTLIRDLFAAPTFREAAEAAGLSVLPSPSFRHIAMQKEASLTGLVLSPPHDHLGEQIGGILPTGCENAEVLRALMEAAHGYLDKHPVNVRRRRDGLLPANAVWFWAEGTAVRLPNFKETFGKTGGVISAVPLCHGIAALTGLEVVYVEGATGELDTNYEGKAEAAVQLLARGADFAAVHVEAPDECTHNGDLPGKLQAIEWLDSRVLAPLQRGLDAAGLGPYRLLLLSDHKTLTETRGHDGDPVPYLLYDSRRDTKSGASYCEADGARGSLLSDGTKLMEMLFQDE